MKKTILALTALLLVAFLLSACAPSTPDWREFVGPDGDFSVQMPAAPQEQVDEYETDSGKITVHMNGASVGGMDYIMAYSDYPAELVAAKGAAGILQDARDGAVTNTKGSLVTEQALDMNGNPGLFLQVGSPDGKGLAQAKLFLVGNRLFQIFVAGPKENAETEDVQFFLDSFMLK
jgi:hypothetical protein